MGASTEPADLVIARRYEVKRLVGRGGYGMVFEAVDRLSGETVAIKMLTAGADRDPNGVERMAREQQAMVALAGTGAVNVIELCRAPSGALCLVMEWLDGQDLEQRLERYEATGRRHSLEEVLVILRPVVDTLEKAHGIGIVHRDLKPANIFLLRQGGIRLLDFGLSRMQSTATLTAAGTVMGSPSYIAPETWRGNSKSIDQRADIYSLAVIVFRALSGRLPFEGGSLVEKLQLATSAPRPSLVALAPELPAAIDDWVAQALAIDPDQRFHAVRGLYNALTAINQGRAPPAHSTGVTPSAQERARQRSAWAEAVDAAAAMLKRLANQ